MPFDSKDHGPNPWVVDIEDLTKKNTNFRTAKWTGKHLQMTVMSIPVGGEVGLEKHGHIDQFLRIEQGTARVMMGPEKDQFELDQTVEDDWAIFIPAGTWHNIVNTGEEDLKLYSIYSPAEHPAGTIHETYQDAMEDEHDHE